MTYEKFEDKVIGMLLRGDDPKLKKINEQLAVSEVLSREETNMGFEIGFSVPSELVLDQLEGRISGVQVQLSDYPLVNVELVAKNGTVNKLKASYTTEMTYSELIEHYSQLTFVYTNGRSSDVSLRSGSMNLTEAPLVKNIDSMSAQFNEPISQPYREDDVVVRDTESVSDIEERIGAVRVEANNQPIIEDVDSPIASSKGTIIPDVKHLERIIASLDAEEDGASLDGYKSSTAEKSFGNRSGSDGFEEIIAEVVGDRNSLRTPFTEATPRTDRESIMDDVLKNYQIKKVEEEEQLPQYDDIMLPPSYSIPKVPDAIKEGWSNERVLTASDQVRQEENLKQEILTQILSQKEHNSGRVALKEEVRNPVNSHSYHEKSDERYGQSSTKFYESNIGLSEMLDGKAPQGGGSFVKKPVVNSQPRFPEIHETSSPAPMLGDEDMANRIKENFEYKNLTPKELSNPNLKVDHTAAVEPELLESIALSDTDQQQMNLDIARMEMVQRGTEVKIAAVLIGLGIICILGFIIIAIIALF